MKKGIILFIPLILIAAFTVGQAEAQSPVAAEVDRTTLSTDEILSLTVSIDASVGLDSSPQLPPLDGFEILGSYSGTQMSLINGAMSIEETYTYQLRPTRVGELLIDSIVVNIGGQIYGTEPIQIIVTQGTGIPQPANPLFPNVFSFPSFPSLPSFSTASAQPIDPAIIPEDLNGQDFYVEALVDNHTPFQGQQLLYTLRFYRSVSLVGQANYQNPSFSGFWTHDIPEQEEFSFSKGGRNYQMTELKTILFPTVVGDVTIDPATFTIPGGFFTQAQDIHSEPLTIKVKPLPEGAPAAFSGAVGHFDIASGADKAESMVNETVTWRVTIGGQGNIDKLTDPEWPELSDWRAFDSEASVTTEIVDGIFTGTRISDRVLVPTKDGSLQLPPITFTYFDPDLGQYKTTTTEPIDVKVTPPSGSAGQSPAAATGSSPGLQGEQPVSLSDLSGLLSPNKPAEATWTVGSPEITDRAGYWLLFTAPVFLVFIHLGWQFRKQLLLENADSRRSQKAKQAARHQLASIKSDDPAKYEIAGRVLSAYISARASTNISGMTTMQLSDLLLEQGVDPSLVAEVQQMLALCDMGRYSPLTHETGGEDIISAASGLVNRLDKSFRV